MNFKSTFQAVALLLSIVVTSAQASLPCGRGTTLNIGVFAGTVLDSLAQDHLVPLSTTTVGQITSSIGAPVGFDEDLYCAIAQLLNKKVVFKQLNPADPVADGFARLASGDIDMFGGTILPITTAALATNGYVRTDIGATLTGNCLSLIFSTALGAFPIDPDTAAGAALAELAALGVSVGAIPGTPAAATLLAAGFTAAQIVDISGIDLTDPLAVEAALAGANPAGIPLAAIYALPDTTAATLIAASAGALGSITCVPFAPAVASLGTGIAFDPSCCALMNQVQAALNIIIQSGSYANLVEATRIRIANLGVLVPAGLGSTFLVPPVQPNDSILNGFIPNSCFGVDGALPRRSCLAEFLTHCAATFDPFNYI